MNILIAQGTDTIRRRINSAITELERIDLVVQARTVRTAVDIYGRLEPDVFILDSILEGGSALEVVKQIDAKIGTRLLVLLDYEGGETPDDYLRAGVEQVIDKKRALDKFLELLL